MSFASEIGYNKDFIIYAEMVNRTQASIVFFLTQVILMHMFQFADRNMKVFKQWGITDKIMSRNV